MMIYSLVLIISLVFICPVFFGFRKKMTSMCYDFVIILIMNMLRVDYIHYIRQYLKENPKVKITYIDRMNKIELIDIYNKIKDDTIIDVRACHCNQSFDVRCCCMPGDKTYTNCPMKTYTGYFLIRNDYETYKMFEDTSLKSCKTYICKKYKLNKKDWEEIMLFYKDDVTI